MCFYRGQVLKLFEEFPRVGELLQEHLLPCSKYLGPDAPTGLEATACDIASIAGEVFDYGPKDFSKETFLRVLKYLTIPIKAGIWLERAVYDNIVRELERRYPNGEKND